MKNKKMFKSKPLLFLILSVMFLTVIGSTAYYYNRFVINDKITGDKLNVYIDIDSSSGDSSGNPSGELSDDLSGYNRGIDTRLVVLQASDPIVCEDISYENIGPYKVTFVNDESSTKSALLRISYSEMWSGHSECIGIGEAYNAYYKTSDDDLNPEYDEYDYTQYIIVNNNLFDGVNIVDKDWTEDFLNDFVLGNDGWYYYKKILNPGDSVRVLNSTSFNEDLLNNSDFSNRYLNNFKYDIDFVYEAIDTTYNNVEDAWGVDCTITDDTVNWDI